MLKLLKTLLLSISTLLLFNSCNDYCKQEEQLYYFPPVESNEWATITAEEIGWNIQKLNETIDFVKDQRSGAFIVLYNGKIVVEEYWMGWDERFRGKIASVNKSITSVLVGVAQEQGMLNIEDKVSDYLGIGWSKSSLENESKITIRHLLTMTSGLDDYLAYMNDAGTEFFYNTIAFNQLFPVIEKATGKSIDIYADEVLFKKIGMTKAIKWYKGGDLLPRDLVRFGLMMLSEGNWETNGILIDNGYYQDMLSPSQTFVNCYGYLWWLNNNCNANNEEEDFWLIENGPSDLVAALGAGDQKLYVVPSRDLVIVRLGFDPGTQYWGEESFNNQFWELMNEVVM
jgi:CubicO group peptidase (beta-lactamase class C family)